MTINEQYLAGFLDGDGSVYVRLKKNHTYKYGFQIACYIVFFQSKSNLEFITKLETATNLGRIRIRKDNICEWIVSKEDDLIKFAEKLKNHSVLKKKQLFLLIEILKLKKHIQNKRDFIEVCKLVDQISIKNYSKNRKVTSKEVAKQLNIAL